MSKIMEIKVYKFNELEDEAKDKVLNHFRSCDLHCWTDENMDSLKAYADFMGFKIGSYNLGDSQGYVNVIFPSEDIDIMKLKGVRLWKYIIASWDLQPLDVFIKTCPFTGYCMDETLLDNLRDFLKKPDTSSTFKSICNDAIDAFINEYAKEVEYAYSDEALIEVIEVNDYDFTVDGKLFS